MLLDLGEYNIIYKYYRAKHQINKYITTSIRINLVFQKCCNRERIKLLLVSQLLRLLMQLLDSLELQSPNFYKNIRRYNSAFAFTYFKYSKDKHSSYYAGIQAFQIYSEVYYLLSSIRQALEGKELKFAQLYFYNADQLINYYSLYYSLDLILTCKLRALI